jgi:MFS family permease
MTGKQRPWLTVATAGLAIFVAMLDASIVNVALPAIGHDFDISADQGQWVVLAYLLSMTAAVLPCGRWLEIVGHRSAFLFGIGGFALTSLLASAAPDLWSLVGARAAQGLFGAVLLALVPALVAGAVAPSERGRAIGVVATVGPLGGVVGPGLGGLLVDVAGWRAIFLVNLPLSVLLIGLVLAAMPADRGLRLPSREWLMQALVLAFAVLAAMLGVSQAPVHGFGWLFLLPLAGIATMIWSRLPASRPIINVIASPGIRTGLAALTLVAMATAAVQFLAPFFLQEQLGETATTTGLVVLALPAAMALCGLLAGGLADRLGPRPVAVSGGLILVVGLTLIAPLGDDWGVADLVWRLALIGVGLGIFNGPNMTAILGAAQPDQRPTASAGSGLARSLAFACGPLLATAAWSASDYQTEGMRLALVLGIALCLAGTALVLGFPRGRERRQALEGEG